MIRTFTMVYCLFLVVSASLATEQRYQRPSKEILEILDAPSFPDPVVSPDGNTLLLATWNNYPMIADLAEPMLKLAGVRINPRNNSRFNSFYMKTISMKKIPDGAETPIQLPSSIRGDYPRWNPSGDKFVFTNRTATDVELWIATVSTKEAHRIAGVSINGVLGSYVDWISDQKLLVKMVPPNREAPPADVDVPAGPYIEDSAGVTAASSTYENRDLLKTPHDADLFDYYATSQIGIVDVNTGKITPIGRPNVFTFADAAPGGKYLLIERLVRPYSYIRTYQRFPAEVEVWDFSGNKIETLASIPVADQVPIGGVPVGPRDHAWMAAAPHTIVWAEALDDGDTYKKVPFHDRVLMKPIGGAVTEIMKTEQRFGGMSWIETGGLAFVTEYDEDKQWRKTFLLNVNDLSIKPKLVWSMSWNDSYADPGTPLSRTLPNGASVILQQNNSIFLSGQGATPTGNRPFLDRMDLTGLKTERLFRATSDSLESFLEWVDPASLKFLTYKQSTKDPPNVFLRTITEKVQASAGEAGYNSTLTQITDLPDPTPMLRKISKRLVHYKRADGVNLFFTLYLPPDYKEGTKLPTILWAYPLDYTDPATAGQVVATPNTFTTIWGASPIFLTLQGYAVLDDAAMPVVGPTETAYDTFVDQIVSNAKAAIDKAVELGVTDPERVGISGHSHGALMTTNLLAWSDLFRAGIARSGAYNHTLRPFGFQNERRTLYKAKDTYIKLSPVLHADRIDEPLLLIHGERDANPGTVTMQSEKLFEAVRGTGGTVRLVILPLESHGYDARESVEHALFEITSWFDRYVKNAPPRGAKSAKQ